MDKSKELGKKSKIAEDGKTFLSDLFNHRFEKFVFIRVARFFYLCVLIVSALGLVYFEFNLISSFLDGLSEAVKFWDNYYLSLEFFSFLGLVIGLPVVYVFEIIILRLILEAGVALIKIAENTEKSS